jgi:hypothetical protein
MFVAPTPLLGAPPEGMLQDQPSPNLNDICLLLHGSLNIIVTDFHVES